MGGSSLLEPSEPGDFKIQNRLALYVRNGGKLNTPAKKIVSVVEAFVSVCGFVESAKF